MTVNPQTETPRDRHLRRLRRQIDALERRLPVARSSLRSVVDGRLRYVRIPVALMLVAGGFLGFLPVLGFWMIPLGLLLLSLDLPRLRPWVSSSLVRLRRWAQLRLRSRAGRRP
jgi:hypothetical protein